MKHEQTKICAVCGKTFIKPSYNSKNVWMKRKFCSMTCSLSVTGIKKGQSLPESWKEKMKGRKIWNKGLLGFMAKEKHHNWKGGDVEKTCIECGGSFLIKPYRKNSAKFCSPNCKIIDQNHGLTNPDKMLRAKFRETILKEVLKRDNYICQMCGQKSGYLHVDHLQPWSEYVELRFDINNCRTLCVDCHYFVTYGRKKPQDVVWGIVPKNIERVSKGY